MGLLMTCFQTVNGWDYFACLRIRLKARLGFPLMSRIFTSDGFIVRIVFNENLGGSEVSL